jgi:hypothetical protein
MVSISRTPYLLRQEDEMVLAGACGATVYFGDVYPEGAGAPLYVYERCVEGGTSTHVTRDGAGEVVYAESAEHDDVYTVVRASLLRDQLGREATLSVTDDGWTFEVTSAEGDVRVRTERARGPLVVGPTLIGWVLTHELPATVRFAALDRGRTYAFVIERVDAHTVRMRARSPLVGLVIHPITLTFDDRGWLATLDGRVPPRIRVGERWRPLDAHVVYRPIAVTYR